MKLPNVESAVFDLDKLSRYCLDPENLRGANKARVFRAALGLDASDAVWLCSQILDKLPTADAKASKTDGFGARFYADISIARQGRTSMVMTAWIVRANEDFPRFVSTWVL